MTVGQMVFGQTVTQKIFLSLGVAVRERKNFFVTRRPDDLRPDGLRLPGKVGNLSDLFSPLVLATTVFARI